MSWFIAVNEYGFGVDTKACKAIRTSQAEVPLNVTPTQLIVYKTDDEELRPTGWKKTRTGRKGFGGSATWPDGTEQPKMVGLTNTHQLWEEAPRI
jgi:hypothetical protein